MRGTLFFTFALRLLVFLLLVFLLLVFLLLVFLLVIIIITAFLCATAPFLSSALLEAFPGFRFNGATFSLAAGRTLVVLALCLSPLCSPSTLCVGNAAVFAVSANLPRLFCFLPVLGLIRLFSVLRLRCLHFLGLLCRLLRLLCIDHLLRVYRFLRLFSRLRLPFVRLALPMAMIP